MISWALFMKLLHILSAILFVGGLLGRGLTYAAARQAGRVQTGDVQTVYALLQLSDRFDKLMVRPGSEIVFLFGLLTAWAEGQPLFGFLAGAGSNWLFTALVLYLLTIPLAIVVLLPRSRRRRQAAEAAIAQHQITPELRAALGDRSVTLTRGLELLIVLVVIGLMVLKPF